MKGTEALEQIKKAVTDFEKIKNLINLQKVPIATLMGPGSAVFASIMGPPFRQGHGARIAGEERVFARVMGPPLSQGHGAR